ncbi:hypothetical protein PsorP6_007984 [Peronosclerospora sorghi]|uniref:Uncharacterized protein n=1 Tax=Peronosclerospora sorghi TaxID=230839 RepID=A0ACC0WAV0_9STRA|nr:hypothetical protein PsorP6_007984 [Peronosclerospora sorghi]
MPPKRQGVSLETKVALIVYQKQNPAVTHEQLALKLSIASRKQSPTFSTRRTSTPKLRRRLTKRTIATSRLIESVKTRFDLCSVRLSYVLSNLHPTDFYPTYVSKVIDSWDVERCSRQEFNELVAVVDCFESFNFDLAFKNGGGQDKRSNGFAHCGTDRENRRLTASGSWMPAVVYGADLMGNTYGYLGFHNVSKKKQHITIFFMGRRNDSRYCYFLWDEEIIPATAFVVQQLRGKPPAVAFHIVRNMQRAFKDPNVDPERHERAQRKAHVKTTGTVDGVHDIVKENVVDGNVVARHLFHDLDHR